MKHLKSWFFGARDFARLPLAQCTAAAWALLLLWPLLHLILHPESQRACWERWCVGASEGTCRGKVAEQPLKEPNQHWMHKLYLEDLPQRKRQRTVLANHLLFCLTCFLGSQAELQLSVKFNTAKSVPNFMKDRWSAVQASTVSLEIWRKSSDEY